MDNPPDLSDAELYDLETLGEFSDLDGPVEIMPTRIRTLIRMAREAATLRGRVEDLEEMMEEINNRIFPK